LNIKVLLVDDRQLLLECLSNRLNKEPTIRVVGSISNPTFLLHEITVNSPDIVLMNIQMKLSNGLDLVIELL